MIVFAKAPEGQPIPNAQEWALIFGRPAIGCPDCGCHARLDHLIDSYGMIQPSIVCPFKDCGFHDHGKLEDWKP